MYVLQVLKYYKSKRPVYKEIFSFKNDQSNFFVVVTREHRQIYYCIIKDHD